MTKRDEIIEAVQGAMERHRLATPLFRATAAFDAALRVMSEPSEEMVEAGENDGGHSSYRWAAMLSTLRGEG